jgi:hypothetical protein
LPSATAPLPLDELVETKTVLATEDDGRDHFRWRERVNLCSRHRQPWALSVDIPRPATQRLFAVGEDRHNMLRMFVTARGKAPG